VSAAIAVARPGADEYAPFYADYIAHVPDADDAIRTLTRQEDRVERVLSPLDDGHGGHRYAPGKWSVKELLGHVLDAERIFAYRLLRIARGDTTPLPGFDENAYVPAAQSDTRPLAELLREWHAVRTATIALVRGIPAGAWTSRGSANGYDTTARALLYIILGHVEHHLNVLHTRYGVPTL
jgi:hypothetical protein